MNDKILLIHDMAGYGKVSISAMMPILSHMKFDLFNLPTALVSNTLDYGKFHILDTTDYMCKTIGVWKELGFGFDAISTGLIFSKEQVRLVSKYCKEQSEKGTKIFVDPVMGDEGKLYYGVEDETIEYMKELCSVADYVFPNFTEASFIGGYNTKEDILSDELVRKLIDNIRALGAKSVVITSVKVKGQDAVIGYDYHKNNYFTLPFEYVPVMFPGTGDIFSSIVMGKILLGEELEGSVRIAMDYISEIIELNKDNEDKFKGIPIESWTHKI